MISLLNLTTGYGHTPIATQLNATLPTAQLTCLLGANGAGKSTLLRTIAGFQPALGGNISLNGKNLLEMNNAARSKIVAVVLTERPSLENLRAEEIVAMGRMPHTGFWGRLGQHDKQIIHQAITQVGIQALLHRRASTLSDGERQKVMIAKALAQDTPLILLDEPTAYLDYPSKIEIMRLLRHLAHTMQKSILMSTHDIELALQLAHQLWLMSGPTIQAGTPEELSQNQTIAKFFATKGTTFHPNTKNFTIEPHIL